MVRYHAAHAESLAQQRAYQKANREKYRAACAKWRALNPEKQAAAVARWNAANPHINAAAAARYYCRKKERTPKWLTQEQYDQIQAFYLYAWAMTEATGIQHSVDHIVPLHGERVCGLHVPWNLQVMTRAGNSRKGNRCS